MTTSRLYQIVPLVKTSLMQRLFRQRPEENVIIEINNLIASRPIVEIRKSDIDAIVSKYKIDLYRVFAKNLYEFYAVLLNHFLIGERLDDNHRKVLHHMKDILGLPDYDVDYIHAKFCGIIYRQRFESVVDNGRLSDEDEKMLGQLEANLQLPEKAAQKISEEVRGSFVRAMLDKIVARQRLSPDEEKELKAVSKSLKLDVQVDKNTRQALERFKLLWKLENEPLPIVDVVINLQKGEQCHFTSMVEWHEERITRGMPYWKYIDRGDFFLTNKRVIFSGRIKNTSIRLDKLLSYKSVEKGILLNKDTGKAPKILLEKDTDVLLVLFPRVLLASDW